MNLALNDIPPFEKLCRELREAAAEAAFGREKIALAEAEADTVEFRRELIEGLGCAESIVTEGRALVRLAGLRDGLRHAEIEARIEIEILEGERDGRAGRLANPYRW